MWFYNIYIYYSECCTRLSYNSKVFISVLITFKKSNCAIPLLKLFIYELTFFKINCIAIKKYITFNI